MSNMTSKTCNDLHSAAAAAVQTVLPWRKTLGGFICEKNARVSSVVFLVHMTYAI